MNSRLNTISDTTARVVSFDGRAIRFEVAAFARPSDIEREWRQLESSGVGTVFQRYDWVDAYAQHVLPHEGAQPVIVLGRLGGNLAFVLPLAITTIGPVRVATWIGGITPATISGSGAMRLPPPSSAWNVPRSKRCSPPRSRARIARC